jgi:hypothetical protein
MASKAKKSPKKASVTSITIQSNVVGSGFQYFVGPVGQYPGTTVLASGSALSGDLPATVKVSGYDSYYVYFGDNVPVGTCWFGESAVQISANARATVNLAVTTTIT